MKKCEYCGRENEETVAVCQECGTAFEGKAQDLEAEPTRDKEPRTNKSFIALIAFCVFLLICGVVFLFLTRPPNAVVSVSFSGYLTNAVGGRLATFSISNNHPYGLAYLAMSDPDWTSLLPPGGLPAGTPSRFVQYGRLAGPMRLEMPIPAGLPAGSRYQLAFTYCKYRGPFVEHLYHLWRRSGVPQFHNFPPPGFGSCTVTSPPVAP